MEIACLGMLRLRGAVTLLRACRPVRHEPARVVAAMMRLRSCRRIISSTMPWQKSLQFSMDTNSVLAIPHRYACISLKEGATDEGQAARPVYTYATMLDRHKEDVMKRASMEDRGAAIRMLKSLQHSDRPQVTKPEQGQYKYLASEEAEIGSQDMIFSNDVRKSSKWL